MAMRTYGCWCPKCMLAYGRGVGMSSTLYVAGCSCPSLVWTEAQIGAKDLAGIAKRRKVAQASGRRLAKSLVPGDWLAIQARNVDKDQDTFWIAKAIDATSFAEATSATNGCILSVVSDRRQTIVDTQFNEGDFAISSEIVKGL